MDDIEIEIQVKVENVDALIKFLEKEAKFLGEKHQIDEYLTPAHRDFTLARPIDEWLRIRKAGKHNSINYKKWHEDKDGKTHHCDEYESVIEKPDTVRKILEVLDFKSLCIVDKKRKVYIYKDYEITLDSVKNLGDYVELEYKGDDTSLDPKNVTRDMVALLKSTGCGKIERNYLGYPFQLMFPDEIKVEVQ